MAKAAPPPTHHPAIAILMHQLPPMSHDMGAKGKMCPTCGQEMPPGKTVVGAHVRSTGMGSMGGMDEMPPMMESRLTGAAAMAAKKK